MVLHCFDLNVLNIGAHINFYDRLDRFHALK